MPTFAVARAEWSPWADDPVQPWFEVALTEQEEHIAALASQQLADAAGWSIAAVTGVTRTAGGWEVHGAGDGSTTYVLDLDEQGQLRAYQRSRGED